MGSTAKKLRTPALVAAASLAGLAVAHCADAQPTKEGVGHSVARAQHHQEFRRRCEEHRCARRAHRSCRRAGTSRQRGSGITTLADPLTMLADLRIEVVLEGLTRRSQAARPTDARQLTARASPAGRQTGDDSGTGSATAGASSGISPCPGGAAGRRSSAPSAPITAERGGDQECRVVAAGQRSRLTIAGVEEALCARVRHADEHRQA